MARTPKPRKVNYSRRKQRGIRTLRRIFCATSGGELNPEAINNGLEPAVEGLRENAIALPSCTDSEPDMGFTVSLCHYE